MAFKTWVAGEVLTANDVNTYLGRQAVIVCTSGTRPGSPVEGMTIYETDTDRLLAYDGATWNLPKNVAGGVLGYVQVVVDQTGIGTTLTDLTGLSVAVTVGAGRRIKVSGHTLLQTSANEATGHVVEGSTALGRYGQTSSTTGVSAEDGSVILTPTAGAHTYKLAVQASAGTVNMLAAATYPAFILVEDIGAA